MLSPLQWVVGLQLRLARQRQPITTVESQMISGNFGRSWRRAGVRVAQAWTRNHWILSHRLGSQARQAQDSRSEAAIEHVPPGPLQPTVAAAASAEARRARDESAWEAEAGSARPTVPDRLRQG